MSQNLFGHITFKWGTPGRKMKNLLVVIKNKHFRQFISTSIKANIPGINCYAVANGQDAVQKANELRPQIIFVDISLPSVNGLKVTEIVKNANRFSCVIILSGDNQPEYIEAAKKSGADYFLPENTLKLADNIGLISDLSNHDMTSIPKWERFKLLGKEENA